MKRLFVSSLAMLVLVNLFGCEAFVRKFTRKPKKEKAPVEMVLQPEEWKGPKLTQEELYRQYYIFWQSWHEELISALANNVSLKKRTFCAKQTIKNLEDLKRMLKEEKAKLLDNYIQRMQTLLLNIQQDIYGNSNNRHRQQAEVIKKDILQRFSYPDVKEYLK